MSCEKNLPKHDASRLMILLLNAVNELQTDNGIGERKLCEWIQGSSVKWKNAAEIKEKLQSSNTKGKRKVLDGKDLSADYWLVMICQAVALGLFEVMFHTNRFQRYQQTNRTILLSEKGKKFLCDLPKPSSLEEMLHAKEEDSLKKRSKVQKSRPPSKHLLPQITQMLEDSSRWASCTQDQYQYLEFDSDTERLLYIPDIHQIPNSSKKDPHFVFNDMHLSKGPSNKPIRKECIINGTNLNIVVYKSPCEGVKLCSQEGCSYIVSRRQQINRCKSHLDSPLIRSLVCHVMFLYISPENFAYDPRRCLELVVLFQVLK